MPQSGPLSWLDVELIADYHKIIMRLDRSTLFVRGYCRNDDTHFWEFLGDDSPLIPRSQSLSYFGSYAGGFSTAHVVPEDIPLDYHPLVGLTGTAGMERHQLPLAYQVLQDAIISLAVMKDPCLDMKISARSLLIMIQMITEAARIEIIGENIAQNWWNPQRITLKMLELENAWGTPYSLSVNAFSRMKTLSIDYVRLNRITGESPVELYGTVMVKDHKAEQHVIYGRSSDDPESKGPGDYISLTGPSTSISGEEAFTISVSLCDHDNQMADGIIEWDPIYFVYTEPPLCKYNVPQVEDVVGDCGSASVQYSIVEFALSANVSVELFNCDPSSTNVYGTIKAKIECPGFQSWMGYKSLRMLFDKSEGEYVQVPHSEWQSIPLTRPVFIAPVDSYVTIEADLRVLPHCNLIAQGSVQFTPTCGTQPMKMITGRCGSMKVSITCCR